MLEAVALKETVDRDTLATEYKRTGKSEFLTDLIDSMDKMFRKKAVDECKKYGYSDVWTMESVLRDAVWNAAEKWDITKKNTTNFYTWAKYFMGQAVLHFIDDLQDKKGRKSRAELVLCMDNDDEDGGFSWESWEKDSVQDIAIYLADNEQARSLIQAIKEYDDTCAKVAYWKGERGLTNQEVAQKLGYEPEGKYTRSAQEKWTRHRLAKAQIPVKEFYARLGIKIPIKLRDN